MIYFDNSATTYPNPASVNRAMVGAMKRYGANPGRSGHTLSRKSGMKLESCRKIAAEMFGAKDSSAVVFTINCTAALNMVIKGILKPGDHVVTSCLEHNAVMRPLKSLEAIDVSYTTAQVYPCDPDKTVDSFRKAITSKTALIITTHASNVWGVRMPVKRIAALGKVYGIPVLVDAAQSAGLIPIDITASGIDYLCVAGHKGLYGPMGTGMMITSHGDALNTIIEGGTGTDSMKFCQPKQMPQKFESGTPNMPGICGLCAGMEFVKSKGIDNIFEHESRLISYIYDKLSAMPNVQLYMPKPQKDFFVPIISFNIKGYISDEIGKILDARGIEVRTGLQCAPSAHEFAGTSETGVVRVSPSVFSTHAQAEKLVEAVSLIPPR